MAFTTSGFSEILCIFWCTFIGTAKGWVSGAALRGEVTPSHRSCDEARNCIAGSESEFACINIFICKSLSGIIRGGKRSLWTIQADFASGASVSVTCRFCISSNSSRERFDFFKNSEFEVAKFDFLVGEWCTVIRDRYDVYLYFLCVMTRMSWISV